MVGASSGHIYRAYNNSINALERALKERLLYFKQDGEFHSVFRPVKEAFTVRAVEFIKRMKKFATSTRPTPYDDFVNSFSGRKKERYLKAAENLKTNQYNFLNQGIVKMFLKFESYNLTLKPDAKPRGIYPRTDEFLVEYGRRIKAIEKKIYQSLKALFGYDVIFKGKNQRSRGALLEEYWNVFKDPVAISADASAFEASVSVMALEFSHKIYNQYIFGDLEFTRLQKCTLHNKITAFARDGSLKMDCEGCKMSGDPDTALGNCLISAYMMWNFFRELGIEKHRACVDGDDVVFIVERRDLGKIMSQGKSFYKEYGFRMIFEDPVFELEKLSFCQSQPIWTEQGYLMVRNVKSAVAKDAFSRKDLSSKTSYLRWIASVGECGLACSGGVPILQEVYAQYIRNSHGAKVFENENLLQDTINFKVQGMTRKYQDINPRTRYSFYIAFGICPDEQVAIENYYSTMVLEHGVTDEDVMPTRTLPW
jgi:hypothetical protein